MAKSKKAVKKKSRRSAVRREPPPILVPGQDYELDLPSGHLSFSQIDLVLRCGFLYEYQYVQGHKRPVGPALVEGGALGKVLETTHKQHAKTGHHLPREDAISLYEKTLGKELKTVADDQWYNDQPEDLFARGRRFLHDYWPPVTRAVVEKRKVMAEAKYELEIAGVPVEGYVDLIDPFKGVVDFKVAAEAGRYNVKRSLQLSLYAVAFQVPKVAYCVFEKWTGNIRWLYGKRKLDETHWWLKVVVSRVAAAISERRFVPTQIDKDKLCDPKWCPRFDICAGMRG